MRSGRDSRASSSGKPRTIMHKLRDGLAVPQFVRKKQKQRCYGCRNAG